GIGIIAVGLLFLINAGVSIVAMADRSEDGTTADTTAGRTVNITAGSTADTAADTPEHLASTPSVHVARTSFML
ncbi:MAG: hypothetical protein WA794_18660, partial [Trebonia sp.]